MATFDISIPGCILCCDSGSQIEAGENLSLTIDGVKYPGLTTNPVSALVNSLTQGQVYNPATNALETGYTYNVTVSDSDMPVVGGMPLTELDITDIVAWECESCCVALDVRVTALEAAIGLGTTYFITGPVVDDSDPVISGTAKAGDTVVQVNVSGQYEFWTYDGAAWGQDFKITSTANVNLASGTWDVANDRIRLTLTNATNVDVSVPDTTVDAGAANLADVSMGTGVFKPGERIHFWTESNLEYFVANIGNVLYVKIDLFDILVANTAGAPASPPRVVTGAAIQFDSNGVLYYWDPFALIWKTYTGGTDLGALDIAPNGGDANIADITHTGSDGVPDVTTNSTAGVGIVNSFATASVTGNTTGTYTVHEVRGYNDGTALDTPTSGDAQKVLIEDNKAGNTRTATIRVEDWVEATLFVDPVFGDNATGLRERRDRPFADYDAAHTAASDGDVIVVRGAAGIYTPPTPAQGIYAIGKSLTVDLTQCRSVLGTLLAEDGETITVVGECDFYNFNADGGNIRGRIGKLTHPATFASTALDGGGFSPIVELDVQEVTDGGGGAATGFLFTSTGGSVVNLRVRGDFVSADGAISINNGVLGAFDIVVQGDLQGSADELVFIDPNSNAAVVVGITVHGDMTNSGSGGLALDSGTVKVKLTVGGTIESDPADNALGAEGVITSRDDGLVVVRCHRILNEGDGACLAALDRGKIYADVALYELTDTTGFVISTADPNSSGSGTGEITMRGSSYAVYPSTTGNFHDNVANGGSEIRIQGVIYTNLTSVANTALPWPVEGADATGCTAPNGTYTDSADLTAY